MMQRKISRYGWRRDNPDIRDYQVGREMPLALPATLPPLVDLGVGFAPCYDQGDLGSCTANALAGALEFNRRKEALLDFAPSRLFIYYNERVMENTVKSDAGAEIRDGIKSVATLGAPPETLWPYDEARFAKKPPAKAFAEAAKHLAGKYARVPQNMESVCGVIASGEPVLFGFTAYEAFESDAVAKSGLLPLPQRGEVVVGGHAVVAVGYDLAKRLFLIRNSWGTGWGLNGYFWMPFDYLLHPHLASDLWVIQQVS